MLTSKEIEAELEQADAPCCSWKMSTIFTLIGICCVGTVLYSSSVVLLLARKASGAGYESEALRTVVANDWFVKREDPDFCTPVIIIKTGRSGSTWMYDILNNQEETYLLNELEGTSFARSADEQISWLASHLRCIQGYSVVGFTIDILALNRKNSPFSKVSLRSLALLVPNLKVILWTRSNLVKHAVAWERSIIMEHECGLAYKYLGRSCIPPLEFEYPLQRIIPQIMNCASYNLKAQQRALEMKLPVYYMYYEDWQTDLDGQLDRLYAFLNHPELVVPGFEETYDGMAKLAVEDLSETLLNYYELKQDFNWRDAPCVADMLSRRWVFKEDEMWTCNQAVSTMPLSEDLYG